MSPSHEPRGDPPPGPSTEAPTAPSAERAAAEPLAAPAGERAAAEPPSSGRPSVRRRIEEHPVGLFAGAVVAAITATLAIVVPLAQLTMDNRVSALEVQMEEERMAHAAALQDLRDELESLRRSSAAALAEERARAQERIDELDRSLSSIRRSLGPDTEYFDVASLVVGPGEAASLPPSSAYFADDRFYALDAGQVSGWTYEISTELALLADLTGRTEAELRSMGPVQQADALTRFPVHLWRLGGDRLVRYLDPISGQELEFHPRTQVSLQRVSHEDYLAVYAERMGSDSPAMDLVRAGFARDPAGWVLQDLLGGEIATSGGLRPRIDSLQKRDRLAYARVEATLPDVRIGDLRLAEYYWSREWLLIATDRDLYLVKLFVGDDDHRSPDYGSLSSWLDGFRVLGS
jgi:hypothetical protein